MPSSFVRLNEGKQSRARSDKQSEAGEGDGIRVVIMAGLDIFLGLTAFDPAAGLVGFINQGLRRKFRTLERLGLCVFLCQNLGRSGLDPGREWGLADVTGLHCRIA